MPMWLSWDSQNRCNVRSSDSKISFKISGPLLDRIDIHIETPAVKIEELQAQQLAEESSSILKSRSLREIKEIVTKN